MSTILDLDSAFKFPSMEKAQQWRNWLEGKFPEYSYQIYPNLTES